MRTVSAADANRHFSNLLQEVKAGTSITVTSRGEPVAQITPIEKSAVLCTQTGHGRPSDASARPARLGFSWTRDELYDE